MADINPYESPQAPEPATTHSSPKRAEEKFHPIMFWTRTVQGLLGVCAALIAIVLLLACITLGPSVTILNSKSKMQSMERSTGKRQLNRQEREEYRGYANALEQNSRKLSDPLAGIVISSFLLIVASLVGGLAFIAWQYLAYLNLKSFGIEKLGYQPAMVLLLSLIPLLNVFICRNVLHELWQNSALVPGSGKKNIMGTRIDIWLIATAGSVICNCLLMLLSSIPITDSPTALMRFGLLFIGHTSALIATSYLILIVGAIGTAQSAKHLENQKAVAG